MTDIREMRYPIKILCFAEKELDLCDMIKEVRNQPYFSEMNKFSYDSEDRIMYLGGSVCTLVIIDFRSGDFQKECTRMSYDAIYIKPDDMADNIGLLDNYFLLSSGLELIGYLASCSHYAFRNVAKRTFDFTINKEEIIE